MSKFEIPTANDHAYVEAGLATTRAQRFEERYPSTNLAVKQVIADRRERIATGLQDELGIQRVLDRLPSQSDLHAYQLETARLTQLGVTDFPEFGMNIADQLTFAEEERIN